MSLSLRPWQFFEVPYNVSVGVIDSNRSPYHHCSAFVSFVQDSLVKLDLCRAQVYLISDGFASSKFWLLRHMLFRVLSLKVGISALRSLCAMEHAFYRSFDWIPRHQRIIGESAQSTLLAIALIRRASLVICNSGSFSNVIYSLYGGGFGPSSFVWFRG